MPDRQRDVCTDLGVQPDVLIIVAGASLLFALVTYEIFPTPPPAQL